MSAAIRLSDYNALLAHGGRGSCREEVPMVPDDPERRAVTGGLSLSYAVVPLAGWTAGGSGRCGCGTTLEGTRSDRGRALQLIRP